MSDGSAGASVSANEQLAPEAIGVLVTARTRAFSHPDPVAPPLAGAVIGDLAEEFHEASKARAAFPAQMLGPSGQYFTTVPGSAFAVGRPSLAHTGPLVALSPARALPVDLRDVVHRRRSLPPVGGSTLSNEELGTLLGLSVGVDPNRPGRRVHPSAGALYPIDVIAAVPSADWIAGGAYVYDPIGHALCRRGDVEPARLHARATMADPVPPSAVTFALVATFARTRAKYGLRGYRFALIEAGHLAQAVITTATALGLCCLPWGGFIDSQVDDELELDGVERSCLYLITVAREGQS